MSTARAPVAPDDAPPFVNQSQLRSASSSADGFSESFSCNQCSKVFSRRENLSRHLKTHDSSPCHSCQICGKGFTRSDVLRRHEAGHERWDQQERNGRSSNGSVKRRKVGLEDSELGLSPSSNSSWTPGQPESISGPSQPTNVTTTRNNNRPLNVTTTGNNYQFINVTTASNQSPIPNQLFQQDELFDFSSFLMPQDMGPIGNEWFSYDFYSAMRETGDEWGNFAEFDLDVFTPGPDHGGQRNVESHQPGVEQSAREDEAEAEEDYMPEYGKISRLSSPPNEASEEDKWPFQWNPNSRPILKAHPITIPETHPLLKEHDSRFDISGTTLLKLRAFLTPPSGREYHQSQKGSFILPSLPVINVFIRLFFENFSPQMPVLHHATLNTNTDLPPPLLAAIVIVGAIYSHLKHTRRFAIVLLDIVRWHLTIALECDNSLMRDPMIIYAEALICHTGLWNGNKRAFELAEVVRGALVTHIRRANFGDRAKSQPNSQVSSNIQAEWKQWIAGESWRRLAWVIFAIDCQFPSLLNLPGTISIGEVSNIGCPCDEEFWHASSARNWKNLLGPASIPPSRSFSAAVGPFILATSMPRTAGPPGQYCEPLPILTLNPWSSFLVLNAIQQKIFQFSQEGMSMRTFVDEEIPETIVDEQGGDGSIASVGTLEKLRWIRRGFLLESLSSWSKAYLAPLRSSAFPSSCHFHSSSLVLSHLSIILLDVSLTDLQNAIGKDGTSGTPQAMANLSNWAKRSPQHAQEVALNAANTIISFAPKKGMDDTAPYSLITLFLCHVVLWAFARISPWERKVDFLEVVEKDEVMKSNPFMDVLRAGLGVDVEERGNKGEKVLFRSAAEMLTRLGTWGASLNLALLVHRRAEM